MRKILWFDTETTGLDPTNNDIIHIAGAIYFGEAKKETFEIKMQPFDYRTISQQAIDTHGVTIEEMRTYQQPHAAHTKLLDIWDKYIKRSDKSDKFYVGGYNVRFDVDFLAQFFKKCGDNYLGSYINWKILDPLPMLHYLDYKGILSMPNYKLATVCEHFMIDITAHNALSDIEATIQVMDIVSHLWQKQDELF